jgi:branched-chain amino acid aminotransferase
MVQELNIKISKISESKLSTIDMDDVQFGKNYADHMFIADYKNGEWGDFRIVPYGNISISPACATLHYGQTIFEGLKAYKGKDGNILIFRPDANAKRLNVSAERMCIPELPEEIFISGINELVKLDKNWVPSKPGTSLYIRPFIFATDPYIGIKPANEFVFIIMTSPVGGYYSEPVKVKVEEHYTRAIAGGTGFAKTAANYATALYPAVKAQASGYHQLIWTDGKNHENIEESGTMNIMFVINDTLITAPTGDTILAGITRDSVLTLAREAGMKVEERSITVKEVMLAIKNNTLQEAFGCGTAATIAHIKTIGYQGTDYELPEVAKRKYSHQFLQTLDDIKLGEIADTHNWIHLVQ